MKHKLQYSGFLLLITVLIFGCGPSEKEKQQREQARQDSLEQVRKDSIAQVQKHRQDSVASLRADSLAKARQDQTEGPGNISFSENGSFTVQIQSWRSRVKAQQEAEKWKDRGFDHAFVTEYGNKETGDVWYRVRLGRLQTRQAAQQLQQNIQDNYQVQSWIGSAR